MNMVRLGRSGQTTPPHRLLMDPTSCCVAAAALLLALWHPPHGLGIELCWVGAYTGLPCWGCGLSRSMSCSLRGMFAEAWSYHPFGPILMFVLAGIVIVRMMPAAARAGIIAFLDERPRLTIGLYGVLVASFLAFGVLRAVLIGIP